MTQVNRDKILQRVNNLRAKSDDAGASEAEMNTAFEMAAKLMDSYGIEEAELAIAEVEGRIELDIVRKDADTSILKGASHVHKVVLTLGAIACFTETKVIHWRQSGSVAFIGHRPDTELANFLLAVVREALDREYNKYRMNNPAVGYGAKASFQHAMALRIGKRLWEMTQERQEQREKNNAAAKILQVEDKNASKTDIVIYEAAKLKEKGTKEFFNKAFPKTRTATFGTSAKNVSAHAAGRSAGDRVNLGKAIGQGSGMKAIA